MQLTILFYKEKGARGSEPPDKTKFLACIVHFITRGKNETFTCACFDGRDKANGIEKRTFGHFIFFPCKEQCFFLINKNKQQI